MKNPEKAIIGNKNIGITTGISFQSIIMLPMKSPIEPPQNDIKEHTKQCKKNCYGVNAQHIIK